MIKKYGKSLDDILEIKKKFFEKNNDLLQENLFLSEVARKQPKRQKCKNCLVEIQGSPLFKKHEISYYLCQNCNHLNGEYEDTNEYARAVYVDEVTDYYKNYSEQQKEKWDERVNKIYNPKASFLLECLETDNQYTDCSVLDVGAGSGYFVKALIKHRFK